MDINGPIPPLMSTEEMLLEMDKFVLQKLKRLMSRFAPLDEFTKEGDQTLYHNAMKESLKHCDRYERAVIRKCITDKSYRDYLRDSQ